MGNILKMTLTADQQKQIKDMIGKSVTALNIDLGSTGGLSQEDLDKVAGGINGSLLSGIKGELTGIKLDNVANVKIDITGGV